MAELTTVAFITLTVLLIGSVALNCWFAWKAQGQLMWFHNAGKSMASHQLEIARLDVERQKTEVERIKEENARARLENERASKSPGSGPKFGAAGHNRMTIPTEPT